MVVCPHAQRSWARHPTSGIVSQVWVLSFDRSKVFIIVYFILQGNLPIVRIVVGVPKLIISLALSDVCVLPSGSWGNPPP